MYKVGIAGSTGYTGLELLKIVHRHPELEIGWLTSESSAGGIFSDIHTVPWNYPLIKLEDAILRAADVDVVFLCLPHAASIEPVKAFFQAGVRVIDLSADYRLKDVAIYEKWYQTPHTAPELLDKFAYGLCEIYREKIIGARGVAVPGCYPTSVNLGLYPLAKAGWLGKKVIVDSKSGLSGAGRKAKLDYHLVEAGDNMTPYNVGYRHRHLSEMEQVLNSANLERANGANDHRFLFSPHMIPTARGILSTMYVDVPKGVTEAEIRGAYTEMYADEPFVHLLPAEQMATLAHTTHSNRCAISITPADPSVEDGMEYIITASIDNLLKGASGQAVQNFNISVGIDETLGLL